MSFKSASQRAQEEFAQRPRADQAMRFGVEFLDLATCGIFPNDLVLLGAPTGVGKTQFCINIAKANLEKNKKVHFIALEASENEIERRIKYSLICEMFFADPERPRLPYDLNFRMWVAGLFDTELLEYEKKANDLMQGFENLKTFYKPKSGFDIDNLITTFLEISDDTDLVITDHVHYFDWDTENDNKAIKEIAKTARSLVLELNKPMILVSHLRKRDRVSKELCPGIDEFHGSSDLSKICTMSVTIAPGGPTVDKKLTTYFRIPKMRDDGSFTRYLIQATFNPRGSKYDRAINVGWASQEKFGALAKEFEPWWARPFVAGESDNGATSSSNRDATQRVARLIKNPYGDGSL